MADFRLEEVVPWGRSFDEYVCMFSLTDVDLDKKILGCGDGPASFNYELTQKGGSVVSVDPLYQFSSDQIRQRINETSSVISEQLHANKERFIWTQFASPDEVVETRLQAMILFLSNYGAGLEQGRYVNAVLPELPFSDQSFDIALCSHFLFLYSEQIPGELHLQALREMLRVARDVRVFPLLDLRGDLSPHLQLVTMALRIEGFQVDRVKVNYEFQQGGNEMLRVTNAGK